MFTIATAHVADAIPAGCGTAPPGETGIEIISAQTDDAVLVDARPTLDYREPHVGGAVSVSFPNLVRTPDQTEDVMSSRGTGSDALVITLGQQPEHGLCALVVDVEVPRTLQLEGGQWRMQAPQWAGVAMTRTFRSAPFSAGSDMVVIDIRRAEDYAEGHIKGAVNVQWGTPAMYEMLPHIPSDKPVFVYCYSGQTAGQAVTLFNIAGIPARSINLSWNFGLSRTKGIQEFVETTENTLPGAVQTEIPAHIMEAYRGYYEATAAASGTRFANNVVSEENAKAIHDAGDEDVLFVSIRKPGHYAEAHIEGAINIPFGPGMQENFASLPADKKLLVYCCTGQTAGQTVAGPRMLGFDAVSLMGGFGMAANEPLGWTARGCPTVSSN